MNHNMGLYILSIFFFALLPIQGKPTKMAAKKAT
jgi:hypothetical protein